VKGLEEFPRMKLSMLLIGKKIEIRPEEERKLEVSRY
jgi:hypothetical protein